MKQLMNRASTLGWTLLVGVTVLTMNVSPSNAAQLTAAESASTGVLFASDDTDATAKVRLSDISIVKSSDKASTALPMR